MTKIYVKGDKVVFESFDKEVRISTKDVEDYILELSEQVEAARHLSYR